MFAGDAATSCGQMSNDLLAKAIYSPKEKKIPQFQWLRARVNDEFQYGDRCGVIFSPYIIGPITALHSPAAAFCGLYQGGWVGYNTRAEIDLGHKVIDNTVTKKLVGDHDCDKQPNRVLWRVRRGNQLVLALTIVKQLVSHHYSLQLQCDSINVVRQL